MRYASPYATVRPTGLPMIAGIGLNPSFFAAHSPRRTKATLIYRRTGNLWAVQLFFGHKKIEGTVRYLGIEVDDALALAEQVDV
jgi:integrase